MLVALPSRRVFGGDSLNPTKTATTVVTLGDRPVLGEQAAAVPEEMCGIAPSRGDMSRVSGAPLAEWATADYNVVMPVVSIRFSDEPLHQRLKDSAHRQAPIGARPWLKD